VARLRREKGHDVLLDAFALVRREVPTARLVLVGDGEFAASVRAQVTAMGLGESVVFAGVVPDVWPYLAEADVFALASRSEAFGIAVVEAMAAGLPIVASASGGIPELVEPGVSGDLFPPGDHRVLASHLVRLLRSPERRAAMGQAARVAAAGHRRERAVERYMELYEQMLAGTAAPYGRWAALLGRRQEG
jgi:glycosyltransferase involved in cell wall biosynthesis